VVECVPLWITIAQSFSKVTESGTGDDVGKGSNMISAVLLFVEDGFHTGISLGHEWSCILGSDSLD